MRLSIQLPFPGLLSLLFVATGASCSPEGDLGQSPGELVPVDGSSLQRLELQSLGNVPVEAPREREARSWSGLGEAGAIEGWELNGAKSRIHELDGQPILAIYRKEEVRIEIPTQVSLRDTPQVTLDLVVRNQGYTIRGELLKDGVVQSEASLQIVKAKNFQTLEMTFPPVVGESLECDRIVLKLPAGDKPMGLTGISIQDVALGGYLPEEAFGGLALVEIGSDARRGTCISNRAGAKSVFPVEHRDQELSFSYSTPRSIIVPGPDLRLKLSLRAGASLLHDQEFEFEGNVSTPAAWVEGRVQVGEWVGKELEAHFELISPDSSNRLAVLGEPQLIRRQPRAQTVLLISSDTHRSDHLGFLAGEEGPQTEMLDRLAAEGVAFLDATSSINNTTPSHVALFTGLNPRDTGIVANAIRLADAAPTLAERFAELGYATLAAVSAAPVCSQFSGLGQGFDRYSNPGYRSARDSAETLEQLMKWLPDYEGRPLFVWLHVYDAHAPYEAPQEFVDLYYPTWLKPRDPASPVADFDFAPEWDPEIADPVYTESAYRAEVTYVDHRLSELLSQDRFWNGTIAFTADHGETLRNGGENRFGHRGLSHANLAIPMIFRAPGLEPGTRRRAPVEQIDVGRTLLDLAGHGDTPFPGKNLFEVAEDETTPRFAMQANGFSASVLSGKWMLTFGLRPTRSVRDSSHDWLHNVALFDTELDEACRKDLSAEQPERTAKLRRLVVRWLEDSQRNRWESEARGSAEDIQKKLTELGYTSSENGAASEDWIEADCTCVNCARFE